MSLTPAALRRSHTASAAPARALAVLIALHGLAHFAGSGDAFRQAAGGEPARYLTGGWTVADPTVLRGFGVLWALLGVAFVVAAVTVWARRPCWPRVLGAVSLVSLLLVGVALWPSVVGVVIDLALLAVALRAGGRRRGRARR